MPSLSVYTAKGTKVEAVSMPKGWYEKENDSLLAQAIRVYEARSHPSLSKVKTRGEVSYSTRKIYKQKGTGRARHGDRGAPIFVGGGVAHGPKGVKRVLNLSKKMKTRALNIAFGFKVRDGMLIMVSNISELKKTREAASLIDKISNKEKNVSGKIRFTFALSEKNKDVRLFLRNIENVNVLPFKGLNAYKVFHGGVLIVDKEALNEQEDSDAKELKKDRKVKSTVARQRKSVRVKKKKMVKKTRKKK